MSGWQVDPRTMPYADIAAYVTAVALIAFVFAVLVHLRWRHPEALRRTTAGRVALAVTIYIGALRATLAVGRRSLAAGWDRWIADARQLGTASTTPWADEDGAP